MRERFQRYFRSYHEMAKRNGALCARTSHTLTLWNLAFVSERNYVLVKVPTYHRGVKTNFSGNKTTRARKLRGGLYANNASDFTPSNVNTALLNWISAVAFWARFVYVLLSIATRIVKKSVLPRKANVIIRVGPRNQCIPVDLWTPVPSSPNQIQSIHLAIVTNR